MNTTETYKNAFDEYLRGKISEQTMDVLEKNNIGTNGYMMPSGYNGDYSDKLKDENVFRKYGIALGVRRDGKIRMVKSSAAVKVVAENEAYPESGDDFDTLKFKAHKLAALSKLDCNLISDENFDLSGYITSEFAKAFGRAEENLFLNGTGENEPTGLLTSAETVTASIDINFDDMIRLYFSLKSEYRKNAIWIMNDATAVKLRMLKDASGRYIWNDTNDTVFGRPVKITPYMPDIDNGAAPVAFADLSYYWILERQSLCVNTLTEKYILQHMIGIAANERVDGMLIRPEAAKALLTE